MIGNDSPKTSVLQKVEQKHSLTPRPIPQAKPISKPVNNKPTKTGKK